MKRWFSIQEMAKDKDKTRMLVVATEKASKDVK